MAEDSRSGPEGHSALSRQPFPTMRRRLFLLVITLLCGCAPPLASPPSPALDAVRALEDKAAEARLRDDRETEALALREALEKLSVEDEPRREKLRGRCVEAMVEAGGYASSLALWQELARENPQQKADAIKMIARARQMMLRQGHELLAQVTRDRDARHLQSALCSALAAQELFRRAGADEKAQSAADDLVEASGVDARFVRPVYRP